MTGILLRKKTLTKILGDGDTLSAAPALHFLDGVRGLLCQAILAALLAPREVENGDEEERVAR